MRALPTFAAVLLLALPAARIAHADSAISLGVYLWNDPDQEPVKAQFVSLSNGDTEIEIDGPDGSKSLSHPTTAQERKLLTAAVQDRMKALSMDDTLRPAPPYITVDWHFSTNAGYVDSSASYPLDAVPADVVALEKAVFGSPLGQ